MTWVEVLPCVGIIFALGIGLLENVHLVKHHQYRGIFDKRVEYGDFRYKYEMNARLGERDSRLGIYPTSVEWVHPLWRPQNFPEQK